MNVLHSDFAAVLRLTLENPNALEGCEGYTGQVHGVSVPASSSGEICKYIEKKILGVLSAVPISEPKEMPLCAKALHTANVVIAFGQLCEQKGVASGICPRCPEACFYWGVLLDHANRDVPNVPQLDKCWHATKKPYEEIQWRTCRK